ncbi:gastrula zinc finger protein XlCGF53.1-like [Hyperolius riggenbachi]|uniref:gastrula zinc finger protein XlCGF53.1-like n=1 Tax=Hyperolius riggenbachi TaxID=752182 RepID=UPI0035A315F4
MDHMTTSLRMEEDQSHMTERIFNLTLEIICPMTGESFPPVKSGDHVTITVPPPHSGRHNKEKILEVTRKMMELLIGEVPERCQDVTVCSSMEGCQHIGHKDLYKDTMMENIPPFTSTDVSSNRNPPERCTGPLYSLECLQEDPTIPRHYQDGELIQGNDVVKEEEEETYVRSDQQSMEEGDMMRTCKEEQEKKYVRSDQQSMEEGDMMRTSNGHVIGSCAKHILTSDILQFTSVDSSQQTLAIGIYRKPYAKFTFAPYFNMVPYFDPSTSSLVKAKMYT